MKPLKYLLLVIGAVSFYAEAVASDVPASLSIFPARLELDASHAGSYLLVSAEFADSSMADLTSQVALTSLKPNIVTVSQTGLVIPHGNGSTEIVARYGKLVARCQVSVKRFEETSPVDFRTEVIGALSRGGCNQGACHGSPKGKNGFRLSLRGFEPDLDYRFLTRDMFSRRLNPNEPVSSLLLKKTLGTVAHQGGVRFRGTEPAFRILKAWVAEGCRDSAAPRSLERLELFPRDRQLHASSPRQQVVVRAYFDDGSNRDVTDLAVFTSADEKLARVSRQGVVEFERTAEAAILVRYLDRIETVRLTYIQFDPSFTFQAPPAANEVDRHVFAKHRKLQLRPAPLAGDAVFLRRVYLDLIGSIPTPEETRAFLNSKDARKRSKLIDRLLERSEYASFWALKWADVMRGNRETISERGVHNFHRYLVRSFAADRPFDRVAREIVTSLGNTIQEPAANFYRVSRTPTDTAESFSQLFLGVRIQCAKCHNHPYESITQKDYYGLAAYFARVRLKGKRFGLDDETVYLARSGEVEFPDTEIAVAPAAFGSPAGELNPNDDRRARLADWLTDSKNRYFARSTVNRVWSHLMGQGIVEPIDDFRDSNPPSNSELLDALADSFAKNGFRFKPLIRMILNSHTYQLSGEMRDKQSPLAAQADRYFTRAVVRMLSAEQILDAISTATGIPETFAGYPRGTKAIELAEGGVEHKFLKAFTKPIRDVGCDCARDTEPSLNQVVHLMNNPDILAKIDSSHSRLGSWLTAGLKTERIVENLYLATLSRPPTADELQVARQHVQRSDDRASGLRDLQHALINSNEFLLRH